jgi:hypothetical protein
MGFAVRERVTEALQVQLVIQHGLETSQAILCENEEHIAVGEIEMRAAMALPDVALGRLAQNP